MQRYRYAIDNVRSHLRSLWVVIAIQFVIILGLWFGWSQAPKHLTVHVPPDLRSGATLSVGEVPEANVYAFAFYIFQQLNRWSEDGAKDCITLSNPALPGRPYCRYGIKRKAG